MSLVVITRPDMPVVSLEETKAHLRVDHDDDNIMIQSLVEACTNTIDGPSGWLGRAIVEQTLEWRSDSFSRCDVRLPYPPIIEILSVKYDDENGVEQTLSDTFYRLVGQPNTPQFSLAFGKSWPSTRYQSEAVRIQYKAGWPFETEGEGDDAVTTWTGPAAIKHAVLIMVAELYQNREMTAEQQRRELPFAVMALLSTYRVFA